MKDTLFIIPARGGSKGLPGKNIKPLNGKPLICYSIDIARQLTDDENICVSSDDDQIIEIVENYNLKVPFKRPSELSTDTATTSDVVLHAIEHFENQGKYYQKIVLLQPTSPFRKKEFILEASQLLDIETEMVASAKITDANPYYVLFEENEEGFLEKSKRTSSDSTRRQDVPVVYELNGSIYVINVASFKKHQTLSAFTKLKKYIMEDIYSVDIDKLIDFQYCEFLLQKRYIE
jgi:CMP-N,N'-diacetyllegionaminic acid synthase